MNETPANTIESIPNVQDSKTDGVSSSNIAQNITPPTDTVQTSDTLDGTPKKRNHIPWILATLLLVITLVSSFLILINKSKSTSTQKKVKESPTAISESKTTPETPVIINNPELIKFVKNKLKNTDESGILIYKIEGDYARGTAGTAGGCNWFAAKKGGVWYSFLCIQNTPSCSDAEPFPARVLPVCYDDQNNLTYRNVSVKYSAPTDYGSITFEHPDTFPVELQGDQINIPNIGQGIIMSKFDINIFDYSQDPRITKESMQDYYREVQQGKLSGRSYFSMWSIDASNQIKQTKNGKFFRTNTTFSAFEVCDFKFHTAIEIPIQNKFIHVNIYGDTNKIRNSMANSNLLKLWEGCNEKSFAESSQQKFYDLLIGGGGTPETREWFDAANKVINSLNF